MRAALAAALLSALSAQAFALDGEVSFGVFIDSTFRAQPSGGRARYVSSVEVGQRIRSLRPYAKIATLMDGYNGDGSFHPASVMYDVGADLNLYKGLYLHASHMCWHPVDNDGITEQYSLLKAGYKF